MIRLAAQGTRRVLSVTFPGCSRFGLLLTIVVLAQTITGQAHSQASALPGSNVMISPVSGGFLAPRALVSQDLYQGGSCANGTAFYNSAGVIACTSGPFGTVTSVAMTVPAWLAVGGSPITTNGTLALTTPNQSANFFLASPSGGSGALTPRTIVTSDIATALSSPGSIGNVVPGSGAFTTLSASANVNFTNTGTDGATLYSTAGFGFPPTKSGFFTSGLNSLAMRYISTYFSQSALYATTTQNATIGETGLYVAFNDVTGYQNPTGSNTGQKAAIQVSGSCGPGGGLCWDQAESLQFLSGWAGASGNFGVVHEIDPTNNSSTTIPTGGATSTIYALWLGGQIGAFPISSYLQISPAGINGAVYAAHYGINMGGATLLDTADINTNTHALNGYVDSGAHANGIVLQGAYSSTSITATGNIAATNGSLSNIDLQTAVPANGSFLANAGAAYQNCPLIGCLAGAHEFSAVYLKSTAQFDATKAEYMVTVDSNLNSGKSPAWAQSTAYATGNQTVANGNVYQETVASCTSAAAGSGPSGTGSGIADNTCSWNYLVGSVAASKVGFFNSTVTGANAPNAHWGMANDLVTAAGDTGVFAVGAEFDHTNNGINTATIGYNAINVFLSGNIGTIPLSADINVFHPANGTNFAARYGLSFTTTYEASQATIFDSSHDPIGIDLSQAVYSAGISIKNDNGGTIVWLDASLGFTLGTRGALITMASDNTMYLDSYNTSKVTFRGNGFATLMSAVLYGLQIPISTIATVLAFTCNAGNEGRMAYISDTVGSAAPTFHLAVAGAGATTVHSPAYCDGTSWRYL